MQDSKSVVRGASMVAGVALGFMLIQTAFHGGGPADSPLFAESLVWLLGTATLVFLVWSLSVAALRRRHVQEVRLRDASPRPAAMNPVEQAWDTELRALGFHVVGVLEMSGGYAPVSQWRHYSDEDGRIGAQVSRRHGYVGFSTFFRDGSVLLTRNRPVLPEINLPVFQAINVAAGQPLAVAYQTHLARLAQFAALHGEAIHRLSMADVISCEEMSRASIVPILESRRGWTERLTELAGVLILLGASIYLAWDILSSL